MFVAMGEFGSAVSALLEGFGSGIAVIERLRRRRRGERWPTTDSGLKTEEVRFAKSLKRNRADVETTYTQNLARFGTPFADGDAKAQSSLASILLRLNAGFVSMIGKLIRGESTRSDYKKLVGLSNGSRDEAIEAFEQLSGRLSQSARASLGRKKNQPSASGKSAGPKASSSRRSMTSSLAHSRPKRASEPSVGKTILGSSAPQGWASPRGERSASTKPNSLQAPSHSRLRAPAKSKPRSHAGSQKSKAKSPSTALPAQARHPLISPSPYVSTNRISLVSFASDSTKLGEIPDRKWPAGNDDGDRKACPNGTALPPTPSGEDELKKPRSRFLRLFRK